MSKKKAGRPPFEPTDEQRKIVKGLAALGLPYKDIGYVLGVSEDTVEKYFRQELDTGPVEANARVGRFLYEQAQKNLTAAIFWAKTRMGWREVERHEITGKDGSNLIVNVAISRKVSNDKNGKS